MTVTYIFEVSQDIKNFFVAALIVAAIVHLVRP